MQKTFHNSNLGAAYQVLDTNRGAMIRDFEIIDYMGRQDIKSLRGMNGERFIKTVRDLLNTVAMDRDAFMGSFLHRSGSITEADYNLVHGELQLKKIKGGKRLYGFKASSGAVPPAGTKTKATAIAATEPAIGEGKTRELREVGELRELFLEVQGLPEDERNDFLMAIVVPRLESFTAKVRFDAGRAIKKQRERSSITV
jgi:hypothetical protein